MDKRFLTDVVGEDYQNWHHGDVVFLSTQTGSGKTTFALGVYAVHVVEQGGKVLLLEPRTILVEQIKNQCRKVFSEHVSEYDALVNGITICSYQKLEEKLKNGITISDFDAIIADEAHYFLCDAIFNANTALSYSFLVQQSMQRQAVVVMMSATIEKIREVFLQDAPHSVGENSFATRGRFVFSGNMAYNYDMEQDYDYLDIRYLHDEKEMLEIASMHSRKTLWFCSNKKRGEKLLSELQDRGLEVGMITADNKADDAASIVKSLTTRGKFAQKILLATSVLDVGVSIVDSEVDSVVLDTYDRETFVQMLGRIRMADSGQRLKVYIFARTAQNYTNLIEKQLVPQLDFIENITREREERRPAKIVEQMLNQPIAPSVYTQEAEILSNRLTNIYLNEMHLSYLDFKEGLQKDPEYAIKKQLSWLGLEDTFSTENYVAGEVNELKKNRLIQTILKMGGKAMEGGLSKPEISDFLDNIKPEIRAINLEYVRSNEPLSVSNFNKICEEEGLPFSIKQEEVERKQKYTLIYQNDDAI